MRPPEVFVRPLAPYEGQLLKRLSKQAKHAATRQRAAILPASATAMSAPVIARMWTTGESHVRTVIHDFNERGFQSLRPRFGGGRPRRISSDDEQQIVVAAGTRPDSLGVPFTRWSPAKLARYLHGQGADYLDWDALASPWPTTSCTATVPTRGPSVGRRPSGDASGGPDVRPSRP